MQNSLVTMFRIEFNSKKIHSLHNYRLDDSQVCLNHRPTSLPCSHASRMLSLTIDAGNIANFRKSRLIIKTIATKNKDLIV